MFDWATKAAAAAVLALAAAPLAHAEECEDMMKSVKTMIDKIDAHKPGSDAQKCAASGEALGVFKSFRIVSDGCLEEGDTRTKALAGLDRAIRQVQTEVDKNCE
jgi:hypothetical protein